MFVRDEARLAVSFTAARIRLAELAKAGSLLDASRAAYGDGVTGMTKVGPPGSWPDLSKLVMIHIGDVTEADGSARLPLRWEAAGLGSGLFPVLDADIIVATDESHATMLILTGVYRPPLGKLGALLDRAIMNRVASATIRDFLDRLARAIEGSSIPDGQGEMDADSR